MKSKNKISHLDVSAALQKFINDGGMINHLPDQECDTTQTIGEEKYDIYESMTGLDKLANTGDTVQ